MSRNKARKPEWDDDDDEDEPEWDTNEDDENVLTVCPYCRGEIYDDPERCPKCGQYLTGEEQTRKPMSTFIIVCFILAMVVVIFGIIAG